MNGCATAAVNQAAALDGDGKLSAIAEDMMGLCGVGPKGIARRGLPRGLQLALSFEADTSRWRLVIMRQGVEPGGLEYVIVLRAFGAPKDSVGLECELIDGDEWKGKRFRWLAHKQSKLI